jgi:hypothetical protein
MYYTYFTQVSHIFYTCFTQISHIFHICFRFELALQQNEIMDVFFIDWLHLGDADDTFGSKADNHLKVSVTIDTLFTYQNS